MNRLPDRPPLMPDEPLHSFVSRTALCYGTDLASFCYEVGLSRRGLIAGDPWALRKLHGLTGIKSAELSNHAFIQQDGTYRFNRQELHRLQLSRITLRVCPLCLREDAAGSRLSPAQAAYVRAAWLVKTVRTCVRHGIALVEVDEAETLDHDAVHDLTKRLAPSIRRLDEMARAAEPRRPTDLETYVVAAMDGAAVAAGGLIARMPLYATARVSEMLGMLSLRGPNPPLRELDDDLWRDAGALGFDIVRKGGEAVTDHFSGLLRSHADVNQMTGVNKVFGRFYQWLKTADSGPHYEPVRALLREVIFDNIPLPAGAQVLGVELDRRRLHSIRSAMTETGTSRKNLGRELRAAGALPAGRGVGKGHGKLVAVPVDRMAQTVADLADTLTRKQATEHLNASVADLKLLAAAEILLPITPRSRRMGHVRYSRRTLDLFLAELFRGVTGVSRPGEPMEEIAKAARSTNRNLVGITRLVMEGKLANVIRDAAVSGFRSVLVDAIEIRERREERDPAGLGVEHVAERLKVPEVTARALMRRGILKTRTATLAMSRRQVYFVEEASLEWFEQTYISLAAIGRRYQMHSSVAKRFFDKRNIRPASVSAGVYCLFYESSVIGCFEN